MNFFQLLLKATCFLLLLLPGTSHAKKVVNFDSEHAKEASNLKGLSFVSRVYVPYGLDVYSDNPPQEAGDCPLKGYGFGMGASKTLAYDTVQHYLYAASNQGFVSITDYSDPQAPRVTDLALQVRDKVVSMTICDVQGLLFLVFEDDGVMEIYDTVQRSLPREPTRRAVVPVGDRPSNILASSDCGVVAVCNANNGKELAQGGITLIRNVTHPQPTVTQIPMDNPQEPWNDDYALRKGLHMPLTRRALEYWDQHSSQKDELNFTQVREHYQTAIFLSPVSMAWSGVDESELLVILQLNNGIVRVNVKENKAMALAGLGLKDHGIVPIDIDDEDATCDLKTYPGLFSMRNPEGVATLTYNGRHYRITANEGRDKSYDEWDDGHNADEIFVGAEFGLANMQVVPSVFLPGGPHLGNSAPFNADCRGDHCVSGVKISTGSSAIDFELDPANPAFHRMVLFGGRGWSIFELPTDDPEDLLKLVFDSADDAERTSCQHFPWAYNAQMEAEMAPAGDFPNNTLWRHAVDHRDAELMQELSDNNNATENGCPDRGDGVPGACPMGAHVDAASKHGGPGFENAVVGVACGRLVAVIATEESSLAWLYDITNIVRPDLVQVFSLSPVSETKSSGLAYNEGSLGEVDIQHFFILDVTESPTGKAAVVFDGGASGTLSYWEFDCAVPDVPTLLETSSASPRRMLSAALALNFGLVVMHYKNK